MPSEINIMVTISERNHDEPTWSIHLARSPLDMSDTETNPQSQSRVRPRALLSFIRGKQLFPDEEQIELQTESGNDADNAKYASDCRSIRELGMRLSALRQQAITDAGLEVEWNMEEKELESIVQTLGNTLKPSRRWTLPKPVSIDTNTQAAKTSLEGWKAVRESDVFKSMIESQA